MVICVPHGLIFSLVGRLADRPIDQMRRLVKSYPRFGSTRVHQLLTHPDAAVGGGWRVNFKRVRRLWKQEYLQVPRKQHKCRRLPAPGGSENSCVRHKATHRNHVWGYDFLTERTEDGRPLRLLVVIDNSRGSTLRSKWPDRSRPKT